ncbi:MAG: MFS transporter [Pseudomonadota bacterium]
MDPDLMKKVRTYRWLIFVLLGFSYVLVYFHRLCPAVLAVDLMRDLNATGTLTGLLGAAYFYPYALMQIPAGLLSDSWGARKTITLFFVVAFTGSVILGMSTTVVVAITGRTLVGIGVAMLFVPTMKILAEWFHKREFSLMTGILMAMGGIGSLTAATPLVLVSARIGWRNSFILVGLFTLFLAVLVWIFVRNRPSEFGWPSPAEPSSGPGKSISLGRGVNMVLANPGFWPLAVWFFFDLGIFFSLGGLWGGPFLTQVYGLTKAEGGHILSMISVGMVVGSPVLSLLSDRVFQGRKPVLVLASGVMIVLTGVLYWFTDTIPVAGLYGIFLVMGIFGSAIVVIGFTANKELFPLEIAGTATGLINLFPFAGGAVFQPVLGHVLERFGRTGSGFSLAGYKAVMLCLLVSAAVAFTASILTRETLEKKR